MTKQHGNPDRALSVQSLYRQVAERGVPDFTAQDKADAFRRFLETMHADTPETTAPPPVAAPRPRPTATPRDRLLAAGRPGSGERPLNEVNFLTVAEVASLMRVSKMTVYRLVHSGELPAVRVGKSFRVPEQAVHDYLDNAYFDVG